MKNTQFARNETKKSSNNVCMKTQNKMANRPMGDTEIYWTFQVNTLLAKIKGITQK